MLSNSFRTNTTNDVVYTYKKFPVSEDVVIAFAFVIAVCQRVRAAMKQHGVIERSLFRARVLPKARE